MNWELLTAVEFEEARKACGGVCLLPFGVVEKHGDHLPLGQDMLYIREICRRAAREEAAMVFPHYYFGQINEARHCPGTIALKNDLIIRLLDNICEEISRNGFTKIIIVNGHGGNIFLLKNYCFRQLEEQKNFMVYVSGLDFENAETKKVREAKLDWHAGEMETSSMLYLKPELVKTDRYKDYGRPLKRLEELKQAGLETGMWWYADFPEHLAADKVAFSKGKGKVFVKAHIDHLVKHIRLVKADRISLKLYREFHKKSQNPRL